MTSLTRETDNFEIEVSDAEKDEDGSTRGRVHVKPVATDYDFYDEKIKFTGRSAQSFANTVQDVFDLDDDLVEKLKKHILKIKSEVQQRAKANEIAEGGSGLSSERSQQMLYKILEMIQKSGGDIEPKTIEDDLNIDSAWDVIDRESGNEDLVIPGKNGMMLTDEGRDKLKKQKQFETFEGDPQDKAFEILESEDPLRYYLDAFNKIHKGDHLLKVWELVSALSCDCGERQIHSWAVGPSGSGKSHLKRKLLEFLPNDMYTRKESFSPMALQYKSQKEGPGFMNHQLVYFDEVGEDDVGDAIELMRLMTDQDQDVITHETVKDQEVMTINLDVSNITVWFTSVETIEDEQLKNRLILTNPDASSAQDDAVNEHQQKLLNTGRSLDFIPKETAVIRSMIKEIKDDASHYKPVVPMDINWKQTFNRRLYPNFVTLMGVIAKIHIRNRITRNNEYIIVTKADFELASLIWSRLIDTTVAQTDEQGLKLLRELNDNVGDALDQDQLRNRLPGFNTEKVEETIEKLQNTEELQLINTRYDDGYEHWAGDDVEKLVDNEPEIRTLHKEYMKQELKDAGIEYDEEIRDSVMNSEIPVIEFLEEKLPDDDDETEELPEVSDQEEQLLSKLKEFNWKIELDTLENLMKEMEGVEGNDFHDAVDGLEDKDVIRIVDNEIEPKSNYDKLKERGEVTL